MKASKVAVDTRTVLKSFPDSRENYNVLMYSLFEYWGVRFTEEQKEQMKKCHSVEGISRAARKIWKQGEFRPSTYTQNKRRRNESYVRDASRYTWVFDEANGNARKVRVVRG